MGTVRKNENSLKNLKRFGKERPPANPTSEQKKAGWERKRMAQRMMDLYEKYMSMTVEEFKVIQQDIKDNPQNYTVLENDMTLYAKNPKFILDRLDRHISKAPVQQQLVDEDGNNAKPVILIGGSLKD